MLALLLSIITLLSMIQLIYARNANIEITQIFVPNIYKRYDYIPNVQEYRNIFLAKSSGLLFIKVGESTLQIMDESNFNIILEYNSIHSIKDEFVVTSDGKYIAMILDNKLSIMEFQNSQNNKQLIEVYYDQFDSNINIIKLNKSQKKLYIIRDSAQLEIITLNNLNKQKGLLEKETIVTKIEISSDETWFCLSSSVIGILMYKINIISNSEISIQVVAENNAMNFSEFKFIKDETFIVGQDYWQGINIVDIRQFKIDLKNGLVNLQINPILHNWWVIQDSYPYTNALETNMNGNQIIVGSRSEGIYIIDIENVEKPEVFQFIQVQEDMFSLIISEKNPYLYLFTKKDILIFRTDQANLQMSYPNLYNKHASILSDITNTPYAWRSLMLSDNEHLIVGCSDQGVLIVTLNQQDQTLNEINKITYPFLTYADNLVLFNNEQFLMIPVQDPEGYMLDIYDITDKMNLIRVERIQNDSYPYLYAMSKNEKETLFVCQNMNELMFYEIKINKSNNLHEIKFQPSITFNIPYQIGSAGPNAIIILSQEYQYIILLYRDLSIVALDSHDLNKLKIIDQLRSFGAETIIQGTYQKKYCFISDGLEGVSIMDLSFLPKIKIISTVKVNGYTNYINLINNDKYLITSQLTGGQLSLIDTTNIDSPQVVSYLQFKNEFSSCASVSQDLKFIFVLNSGGVRTIPIKQNIYIHYDFSEIIQYSTGITERVRLPDIGQTLKVGQIIEILLNPIYPIPGSSITNAYYIENQRLKNIPSWISFDQFERLMVIKVIKDSLIVQTNSNNSNGTPNNIVDDQNQITKHTIVFETKFVIGQEAFILVDEKTKNEIINKDMSKKIFNSYKEKGILNHLNQISSQYSESEEFNVTQVDGVILSEKAILFIKRVLQQGIVYSPIKIQLQKSLIFDLSENNNNNYISSFSNSAVLQLKIDKNYGKFITKLYSGVVTSTSDRQDQVKLEGDITNLNLVLQQKIEVYLFEKEKENVQIQIQLNDGINNEYIQIFSYSQIAKIITIKKDISISPYFKLQDQVDRQFSDSIIDINSSTSIELSLDTYENAHFSDLNLVAYTIGDDNNDNNNNQNTNNSNNDNNNSNSNNQQNQLTNQNPSVQFIEQQFKFQIKTTFEDYNKKFCFRVNTTDSYSWVEDSFCVTAKGISFALFLNIFIQVLGPFLFFIGLFKYWNSLFNLTYYKRNICTTKQIFHNLAFVQKFIVVNDSYKVGLELFNTFLKELQVQERNNVQRIQTEHNLSKSMNKSIQSNEILNSKETDVNPNLIMDFTNIDMNEKQNKKISVIISQTITLLQLKTKPKNNELSLRNSCRTNHSIPNNVINTNNNSAFQFQELNKYYVNNNIETKLFVLDLLNSDSIQKNLNKKIPLSDLRNELFDSGSVLHNCLKGLLIKKLLHKNKPTFILYSYIKEYCKIQTKLSKNQWPSYITDVIHSLQQKKFYEEQIIPEVKIKSTVLQNILRPIVQNLINPGLKDNEQIQLDVISQKLGIDMNLIINGLIQDAIGIVNPPNSKLFPNSGESIHLQEHNIKKISAYVAHKQTNNKKDYSIFKKCCSGEYVPLFSRKNQQLPRWLKIKIEKQIITLYGRPPQNQHYSSIKINIFNNNECIIRELIFNIQQSQDYTQSNFLQQLDQVDQMMSPIFLNHSNHNISMNSSNHNMNNNFKDKRVKQFKKLQKSSLMSASQYQYQQQLQQQQQQQLTSQEDTQNNHDYIITDQEIKLLNNNYKNTTTINNNISLKLQNEENNNNTNGDDCIQDNNLFQLNRQLNKFTNSLITSPNYINTTIEAESQENTFKSNYPFKFSL